MRFIVTESEKNNIKQLYNLNEQGVIDALFSGFKSGKEKSIVITKDNFYVGFYSSIRNTEKPEKLRLRGGPENIVKSGNVITAKLQNTYSSGEDEYIVEYTCSDNKIKRQDGYELYPASTVNDDVEALKYELKKFCKV